MPGLIQVRDSAIALLKAALPEVKKIEAFAGDLDLGGLSQKGLGQNGSIFVAVVSAANVGEGLDLDMRAEFGCFCLSRKARKEDREADALALAERVSLALHGSTYGLEGCSPARISAVSNVPDEEVDKSGVNVWLVLWEQSLFMGVQP